LLLPALVRAREQAKLTRCCSNLRQIGTGFHMYLPDNQDRFPPQGTHSWGHFQYGGGDPDRRIPAVANDLAATNRPLWDYCKKPDLFHCTADRGFDFTSVQPLFDDTFRVIGTSYRYNCRPWWFEPKWQPEADAENGFAEKRYSWVPSPVRFVLVAEPPALPLSKTHLPDMQSDIWILWHLARGRSTARTPSEVKEKVISPILFVDGNVAVHDFTKAVKSNWPAEPTADWIWCKPKLSSTTGHP